MSESHLHKKVRRPIPPPFHHLIPSSAILPAPIIDEFANVSTDKTSSSSAKAAAELQKYIQNVVMAEGEVTFFQSQDTAARAPALYTITYSGNNDKDDEIDDDNNNGQVEPYYTEQINETELKIALSNASKRHSSTWATPSILNPERSKLEYYYETMRERRNIGMEIELGHEFIWKLILVAAFEMEWEWRVRDLVDKKVAELSNDSNNANGHAYVDGMEKGNSPKYYRAHPTTYLGGHYRSQSDAVSTEIGSNKKNQDGQNREGNVIFSPSTLGQRVKLGIQKAYDYYVAVIQPRRRGRRSRRQEERGCFVEDFEDEDNREVRRRTSSRLKQGGRGTDGSGAGIKPNVSEQGGAVALVCLDYIGLLHNSDDDKEESADTKQDYDLMGLAGEMLQINNIPKTEKELNVDNQDKNESDNENGNNKEEEINPFFKPKPTSILHHLAKNPKATSPAEIQLGICYAMEDSIPPLKGLDLWNPLNSFDDNNNVTSDEKRPLFTKDAEGGHRRLTLVCTSGDSLKDLPEFEPASFARCRFCLASYVQEEEEEEEEEEGDVGDSNDIEGSKIAEKREKERQVRLQQQMEEKHLILEQQRSEEKRWKTRKQYEILRYMSIQSGFTFWPNWNEFVTKQLSQNERQKPKNHMKETTPGTPTKAEQSVEKSTNLSTSTVPIPITAIDSSITTITSDEKEAQEVKDAALAKSLAVDEKIDSLPSSTFTTTTRRSRRSTAMSTDSKLNSTLNNNSNHGTNNLVFYGSNQSLSAQQLLEAIHRLIAQSWPRPMTLMNLKQLVMDDSSSRSTTHVNPSSSADLKKVRAVLGKLMFRLGKVDRVLVNCVESDLVCWRAIGGDGGQSPHLGRFLVNFRADVSLRPILSPQVLKSEDSAGLMPAKIKQDAVDDVTLDGALPIIKKSNDESVLKIENHEEKENVIESEECGTEIKVQVQVNGSSSTVTPKATADSAETLEQSNPSNDIQKEEELRQLQTYVCSLHKIELTLRALLLRNYQHDDGKGLQQITPNLLSTSADEMEKEYDAMDRGDFMYNDGEDKPATSIVWTKAPTHPLLGKMLFRPSMSEGDAHCSTDTNNLSCFWYKVVSYCPSAPLTTTDSSCSERIAVGETNVNNSNTNGHISTNNGDGSLVRENSIVQRRIRFRAVRVPSYCDRRKEDETAKTANDDDEEDESVLVLTEGQVWSGIHSGKLFLAQGRNRHKSSIQSEDEDDLIVGMRLLLYLLGDDGEQTKQIYYATIAGCDERVVSTSSDDEEEIGVERIERSVLLLLDQSKEEDYNCGNGDATEAITAAGEKSEVENKEQVEQNPEMDVAFWVRLDPKDTRIAHSLSSKVSYKIETQEYHPSSSAYQACQTVLEILKAHVKIAPFLEPVDPIALNIPDYLEVVQTPMDISTIEKKLAWGRYGRIPVGENNEYDSPVSKMLNGPFRVDVMLLFENAMLFNDSSDWVYQDASQLKRLSSKKIETLSNRAEREFQYQGNSPPPGRSSKNKKSVYVDDDSDVDMYMYESDYDDEYDGRKTSRGKKRGRPSFRPQDFATRAVEYPITIPDSGGTELPITDFISNLPIATNVRRFHLPPEWSCRYRQSECVTVEDSTTDHNEKKMNKEGKLRQILLLKEKIDQEQNMSVRRSARSHASSSSTRGGIADGENDENNEGLEMLEYYLKDYSLVEFESETVLSTVARNRSQVESLRESLHEEYFAKLYHKHFSNGSSKSTSACSAVDDTTYGMYTENSFPPFLGRIVPIGSPPTSSDNRSSKYPFPASSISWEIRPAYVLPALHWIIRGLVASGHLERLESLFMESQGNKSSVVITNHAYYCNKSRVPFDVLDVKEIVRRKRSENAEKLEQDEEAEEVEMSAYEKMRAERVARNKERLKLLGLA